MIARFHYDDETLGRLLHDQLDGSASEVQAHVETCEVCQDQLESLSAGDLSWEDVCDLMQRTDHPDFEFPNDVSLHNTKVTFLEASDEPHSIGKFGRYEIVEILGRGGMGIVMRGIDSALDRHCAIKVLAPELASSSAARKRFSREARSAAAVVHPHVVPIQTVDEHEGHPYLVMPVVEGRSLQQRVEDNGPLQIVEVIRIAAQVAEGLSAAHSQGLVHRDIKPANVLLENDVERVQITDFGLARAVDDASMTRSGVIAGTPQYMSPEQSHGDTIDHRSDLFSLGSVMYFMLTGRSPFRAETSMGVLNRICNDKPRSLRSINAEVPPWLEGIVSKLLEKSPDDRFQSSEELANVLGEYLNALNNPQSDQLSKIIESQLVSKNHRSSSAKPPNRFRRVVLAAGFAFFALAGTLFYLQTNKGTLRIESNSDTDVAVRIISGNEMVEQLTVSKAGATTRLQAGTYVIEVDDADSHVEVKGDQFTIRRGDTWIVSITPVEKSRERGQQSNAGRDRLEDPSSVNELLKDWPKSLPRAVEDTKGIDLAVAESLRPSPLQQSFQSPEFPPVKITVQSEDGKPLAGSTVMLRRRFTKQPGFKPLEVSDKSGDDGIAIDRVLPYGDYYATVKTAEGWYVSIRELKIEFEKGVEMTFVAPSAGRTAALAIDAPVSFPNPGQVSALPFGAASRHPQGGKAWFPIATPEPDAEAKYYQSFPTVQKGIDKVAVDLRIDVRRQVPQPKASPSSESLEWIWIPSDLPKHRRFLLFDRKLHPVDDSEWINAQPESTEQAEATDFKSDGFFFDQSSNPFDVGLASLSFGQPQSLPVILNIPAGDVSVLVTGPYGKPSDNVLESLDIDPAKDDATALWLPTNLQPKSEWIARLIDPSDWTYSERGDGYVQAHLIRQRKTLQPQETFHVNFKRPAAKSPPERAAHSGEIQTDGHSISSRRGFDTPETLMKHVADCQSRNDVAELVACWTDEPIKQVAASYLMTATMMLEDFEQNPNASRPPGYAVQIQDLKQILADEIKDEAAGKVMTALALANKDASMDAGTDFAKSAEASASSPLVQLLAQMTSESLKDCRRFVIRFSKWAKQREEPSKDGASRESYEYSIEPSQHDNISIPAERAIAIRKSDGSKTGLIKTKDGWMVNDLWPEVDAGNGSADASMHEDVSPVSKASEPAKHAQQNWKSKLQGHWQVEMKGYDDDGKLQSSTVKGQVMGDHITFTGDGEGATSFALDFGLDGPPKQINIRPILTAADKQQLRSSWELGEPPTALINPVFHGIIEEHEGGFRICIPAEQGERPTDFALSTDLGMWILRPLIENADAPSIKVSEVDTEPSVDGQQPPQLDETTRKYLSEKVFNMIDEYEARIEQLEDEISRRPKPPRYGTPVPVRTPVPVQPSSSPYAPFRPSHALKAGDESSEQVILKFTLSEETPTTGENRVLAEPTMAVTLGKPFSFRAGGHHNASNGGEALEIGTHVHGTIEKHTGDSFLLVLKMAVGEGLMNADNPATQLAETQTLDVRTTMKAREEKQVKCGDSGILKIDLKPISLPKNESLHSAKSPVDRESSRSAPRPPAAGSMPNTEADYVLKNGRPFPVIKQIANLTPSDSFGTTDSRTSWPRFRFSIQPDVTYGFQAQPIKLDQLAAKLPIEKLLEDAGRLGIEAHVDVPIEEVRKVLQAFEATPELNDIQLHLFEYGRSATADTNGETAAETASFPEKS